MKGLLIAVLFATLGAQAQELLDYPLDTVNGEEVYKYQVEKSIGLYRIGVNFNVPQSEIIRMNPQLRERGLHFGETLLLPTGRKVVKVKAESLEVKAEEVKEPERLERLETLGSLGAPDSVAPVDSILPVGRRVIELALMLPFESQQTKRSANAERMMAFYQGALLALHDLQNDSTVYRLRVYDSERSERRVQALCDSTELDSVQGILGLVYPIQIERMAAWCETHRVPLLLPFSDDINLQGRPHIYQFNSPDADKAKALATWIASREDRHCVFVQAREAETAPFVRMLQKDLKAQEVPYSTLALRDLLNDSVAYAIDSFQENIFILHSDRYQQIRMLLPHVNKIGVKKLLVSQFAWQKENIDMPQVYTSKFVQETDLAAYDSLWTAAYKNEHASEMPRYDLLGYDLMRELVHLVRHEAGEPQALQSPIVWEAATEQDGWQNTFIKVISE